MELNEKQHADYYYLFANVIPGNGYFYFIF